MSQSALDDDELFGEAASEMRADVEKHLDAAREELPEPAAIWEVEAENTLGVLNALRGALDVGDAEQHLRDARKWYTMGQRADAFEDADDLEAELETLSETMEDIVAAREQVGELASTVPQLRGLLDDLHEAEAAEADDAEEEAADEGDEDEDEETEE
ncbi:DUF5790 family protein [Halomarina oriensis]|uniref:Uncharacterized protein n=1 Tax=Halomarina oriensis TaxID=671145 RepID=A0A6B0GDK7_9EURY|nr:DUF5790 family protein [Halomarina oriensis]MWG32996.1 hypothetical protein [Halomarina oriensis]